MSSTRKSAECPIFGAPQELSPRVLPTVEDVMKYFREVEKNLKALNKNRPVPVNQTVAQVAQRVVEIWMSASIPTTTIRGIELLVRRFHERGQKLKKHMKKEDVDRFKSKCKKLFDIASCKCTVIENCSCPLEKKVPTKEIPFLLDQRNARRMAIGSVDVLETQRRQNRAARKQKEMERLARAKTQDSATSSTQNTADEEESDDCDESCAREKEVEWKPSRSASRDRKYNCIKLEAVPKIAERLDISSAAAAAVATATLEDMKLITGSDNQLVFDRCKIVRARERQWVEQQKSDQEYLSDFPVRGLFFDGKRDNDTRVIEESASGSKRLIRHSEEHIVMIQEPEGRYVAHISPENGHGVTVARALYEELAKRSPESIEKKLVAVGSDGTGANTGWKNGAIRQLEELLHRPVQWLICLLHFNELPLRALIEKFDGTTSGPKTFTGKIGKQLQNCTNLRVVKFKAMPCDIPEIDAGLLSTDQKYMYEMARAVSNGNCSDSLAQRDPGALNHARWLTAANRILRLYVGTPRPSVLLLAMMHYLTQVYIPAWFRIKRNSTCVDGSKHLHFIIEKSRGLPAKYRAVIEKTIAHNAYFAHPENILLAMVTDDRAAVRELGIKRVLLSRMQQRRGHGEVRFFVVPKLNFAAKDYYEMIDWEATAITPPPVLEEFTDEDLKSLVSPQVGEEPQKLQVTNFPCHSQRVERHVKVVSQAAASYGGEARRDGSIRVKLESRRVMPALKSKKDYKISTAQYKKSPS